MLTVTQMNELTNQINALIFALIGVAITVAVTFGATMKWYLPNVFKRRDQENAIKLKDLEGRLANKNAADSVDIERDKMLPELIKSVIGMNQSFTLTMQQSTQQTTTYIAQLAAHDRQLTANTSRLEELGSMLDISILNIQNLEKKIDQSNDHSKTAAAFGNQAANAAKETLELVRREINKIVVASKHDTGEISPITFAAANNPAPTGTEGINS